MSRLFICAIVIRNLLLIKSLKRTWLLIPNLFLALVTSRNFEYNLYSHKIQIYSPKEEKYEKKLTQSNAMEREREREREREKERESEQKF